MDNTSRDETARTATTGRRALLAAGALGLAGIPAGALLDRLRDPGAGQGPRRLLLGGCASPGPSARLFANARVRTHIGEDVRFYDDLIRGRIVTINFMSTRGDSTYPVTDNLVQVQRLLGDRVGRDLFMYSVTLDPEHDTPDVLREFARRKGVGPGWRFITGDPGEVGSIRASLFHHGAPHPGPDCSVGLVRYGNEALGRWGSFPAKITPRSIARRFSWVGMEVKA